MRITVQAIIRHRCGYSQINTAFLQEGINALFIAGMKPQAISFFHQGCHNCTKPGMNKIRRSGQIHRPPALSASAKGRQFFCQAINIRGYCTGKLICRFGSLYPTGLPDKKPFSGQNLKGLDMLGCSWLRYTQHLDSPRKGARTVRLQESSQMDKMAHYDAPHSLGAPTILIMAAPDF
ncbi:Uncharacterised protein [Klebsiella pneumoniae]|nr:Uncharacterised protein [Klebsiella pneumoniae]SLP16209.1 Uncharacterised protein [Klebsiella pneumoniae]SLP17237.1 Uncharacterised protein [Klebsiella pneumoniae]SLP42621.1 Uncharacterised protein [Klebsiella pneumoniae]